LWELKGLSESMPDQNILITTLSLQEAKESSAIESIITTQDDLYKANIKGKNFSNQSVKEVHKYAEASLFWYSLIKKNELILIDDIIKIQSIIEGNNIGIRKDRWTVILNETTNEVVYTPPQKYSDIMDLLEDLERFINSNNTGIDPLIIMSIIHHQFESIHPFYDWNGRVWRIVNVLYLVKSWLLDTPILYHSRSINKHKSEYYKQLQSVRDNWSREDRILWMITMIEESATHTLHIIKKIKIMMNSHKITIKTQSSKIYSHWLINNVFKFPYTKIQYLSHDIWCSKRTATKYLDELVRVWILRKQKIWRESFYINIELLSLLKNISD